MCKVIAVILLATMLTSPVMAQEATPVGTPITTESASDHDAMVTALGLPPAITFGVGWSVDEARDNGRNTDPRYQVWYISSRGDRIYIAISPYGGSIGDAIDSLALASDQVARMERELIEDDESRSRAELVDLPGPTGCSDPTWAEGFERFTLYGTAAVACLDESQQRVMTVVLSGSVESVADLPTHYISGLFVILQRIRSASIITPAATPVS